MPVPREGESWESFKTRCMSHPHAKAKFSDVKERFGYCAGIARSAGLHPPSPKKESK